MLVRQDNVTLEVIAILFIGTGEHENFKSDAVKMVTFRVQAAQNYAIFVEF